MKNKTEITFKKVNDLIPYINNSRTHDENQVLQIASSIKEFGFTNPILIDETDSIIAGHGRLMAAKKLNYDEVPTIILSGLTDTQKRAYIIADNKLALNAGWDNELLMLELDALKDVDYDLDLTGFSADEINNLLKNVDGIDFPDLPNGDKEPFQQKTFTLHDEQALIVDNAITLARTNPIVDTGLNENSNGNALALICEQWLNDKS